MWHGARWLAGRRFLLPLPPVVLPKSRISLEGLVWGAASAALRLSLLLGFCLGRENKPCFLDSLCTGWWWCVPSALQQYYSSTFVGIAFSEPLSLDLPARCFPFKPCWFVTTLKIGLRWKWILQLHHLLLHKLVSFSLKYSAILDKCSLLNVIVAVEKHNFCDGKGLFFVAFTCTAPKATCCCWGRNLSFLGGSGSLTTVGIPRCSWPLCCCNHPRHGRRSRDWVEGAESKQRAQLCRELFMGSLVLVHKS